MTNADKIRNMTDSELSDWIMKLFEEHTNILIGGICCQNCLFREKLEDAKKQDVDAWLKQKWSQS